MEIAKIDLDQPQVKADASPRPLIKVEKPKESQKMTKNLNLITPILFAVVIGAGAVTGYLLKTNTGSGGTVGGVAKQDIKAEIPQAGAKVGDTYGSADEKTFKDKVTGVVDKSGLNGEGTHKLVRPGGKSQTVCLSSTTIDLDLLVGHQVTLWGQTFNGQKCGWLMDVGRAKVENVNVPLPD